MTSVRLLQSRLAIENGETNATVIKNWKMADLLELSGLDAKDLWRLTKHDKESLIKEVRLHVKHIVVGCRRLSYIHRHA